MLNIDDSSERFFVQTLGDTNEEFVNRQKSVFEKLDAVVKDKEESDIKHSSQRQSGQINKNRSAKSRQKHRYDTRQFRGQESIFKRPEAPPPARFKRNNIPDYVKHPQNWVKYTLSDVSQDDMSERTNTATALSFLRELKAKKEFDCMDVDSGSKQITFKKPKNYKKPEVEVSSSAKYDSPSFRSSKVLMPEYVVGQKKILKRNKPPDTCLKNEKSKEIKLDHLNDEYGEDEDGSDINN